MNFLAVKPLWNNFGSGWTVLELRKVTSYMGVVYLFFFLLMSKQDCNTHIYGAEKDWESC